MRRSSTGLFALALVGGYFVWQNRFKIQRYFESLGIDTPLASGSLADTVRSGFAKVTGSAENEINKTRSDLSRTEERRAV